MSAEDRIEPGRLRQKGAKLNQTRNGRRLGGKGSGQIRTAPGQCKMRPEQVGSWNVKKQ